MYVYLQPSNPEILIVEVDNILVEPKDLGKLWYEFLYHYRHYPNTTPVFKRTKHARTPLAY